MTPLAPPSGQRALLRDVSWSTFESLRAGASPCRGRCAYDGGLLEIMSPSREHERINRLVDLLIQVLCVELGIDCINVGSTTLKRGDLLKAIEGDTCFYIANESRVRGHADIDLSRDPPPDLGIEVEITRRAVRSAAIYSAIGFPELWRHDGRALRFFLLGDDGHYVESERSKAFPMLAAADLDRFLARRDAQSDTQIVRGFQEWVRQTPPPPRAGR